MRFRFKWKIVVSSFAFILNIYHCLNSKWNGKLIVIELRKVMNKLLSYCIIVLKTTCSQINIYLFQYTYCLHIITHLWIISCSISVWLRNILATLSKASSGQLWNQSMVQQLIKDGNIRHLIRKLSPIGDIHKATCRLLRTLSIKKL